MISIEDYLEDIVGKAMRGKGLSLDKLSDLSKVSKDSIKELLEGECNESVISSIAPYLDLDTASLIRAGKKSWRPKAVILEGVSIYNTPWNDMYVNSFLVWDPSSGSAAVFDTGTNCEELINEVQNRNLRIESIFLTHTHGDHIADLPKLMANFPNAELYTSSKEPVDGANLINCGHQFEIGALKGTAFLTHGHSVGGLTYFIKGLNRPIAIVGDALFAGSMGGGIVSYEDALRTNRQHIFSLPDDTVVCPGHGPMTSIKEEKKMNPFYPEYKKVNFRKFITFKGVNFGLGVILGFSIWALSEIITGEEEAIDAGFYLPLTLLITGIIASLPSPKFFFSSCTGIYVGQVAFMAFIQTGSGANLWPITAVMLVPAMLISILGGIIIYIISSTRGYRLRS